MLKDEERSFKLVFVGALDGEEDKVKERFLEEGILPSQLIVRNAKERDQLAKQFYEADLVMMPSRTEEPFTAPDQAVAAVNLGEQGPSSVSESVFYPDATTIQHFVGDAVSSGRENVIQEERPRTRPLTTTEGREGLNAGIPEIGRQDVGSEGQQSLRKYGELVIKLLIDANNTLKEEEKEAIKEMLTQLVQTCDDQSRDLRCLKSFTNNLIEIYKVLDPAVFKGSIVVSLRCPTLESLEHLWSDYRSGDLDKLAERYLVTDDMKKKLKLETSYLKITIDEKNYLNCKKAFMGLPDTCSENPGKDLLHPSETTTTEEKRQSTDVPEISSEGRSLLKQERRPLLLHAKALPPIKEQRRDTDTRRGKASSVACYNKT
ncbi:PREDICTED: uncharacterized protein LOC107327971 [Acropora digitifera]|uniref:uncharacterized protein LOC107327971 n=1 Tax=Acropora digitifera TaxID=70779 RepID=UPI000779F35F|nr:PREDICTED: uncharacterized protein LOC107327971 [Acropora digitifera]